MSLHLPSRRLYQPASSAIAHALRHTSKISPSSMLPLSQHRNISLLNLFGRSKKSQSIDTPLSADELLKGHKPPKPEVPQEGQLADNSIFGPEDAATAEGSASTPVSIVRDPRAMAAALDSKPWARARWQRKKVIQEIQRRGRISKTEQILKQERHHVHGSDFFKTSIKKLMPLARQIAGKSIDEALVQLRFSKKLAARRVEEELKIARDEAIVSKGMGLGHVIREGESQEAASKEVLLKDKTGKSRMVQPTAMYIAQAWVNKTKPNRSPEYRARGRVNMLHHPHTNISFILKEEKTRLRLAKEGEEKKAKEMPWLHHPDRKITSQRQYIMW